MAIWLALSSSLLTASTLSLHISLKGLILLLCCSLSNTCLLRALLLSHVIEIFIINIIIYPYFFPLSY